MVIYSLTARGIKLARATSNPNTLVWQIIHYLDKMGQAADEQIVSHVGASNDEAMSALRTLRRNKIVVTL